MANNVFFYLFLKPYFHLLRFAALYFAFAMHCLPSLNSISESNIYIVCFYCSVRICTHKMCSSPGVLLDDGVMPKFIQLCLRSSGS